MELPGSMWLSTNDAVHQDVQIKPSALDTEQGSNDAAAKDPRTKPRMWRSVHSAYGARAKRCSCGGCTNQDQAIKGGVCMCMRHGAKRKRRLCCTER
eukprot:scaffold5019_cov131-Skeletonema_dohrnii-CCMP3373.AAC.4